MTEEEKNNIKKHIQDIQAKAINHITSSFEKSINPICALDMGMGKTFIACNIIKETISTNPDYKVFIVAKASNYITPWIRGLLDTNCISYKPDSNIFENCIHMHGKERFKYQNEKTGFYRFPASNIIISAYDTLRIDINSERYDLSLNYDLLIFDELQIVMNSKKQTKSLMLISKLKAEKN